MFVDDVILFLSKLRTSIPAVLEVVELLGNISGYKVNHTKSSILPFNSKERSNPIPQITQLHFKVVDQFEYLGIQIVLDLVDEVAHIGEWESECTENDYTTKSCCTYSKISLYLLLLICLN